MNEMEVWLRLKCVSRLCIHHAIKIAQRLSDAKTDRRTSIQKILQGSGLALTQRQQFNNVNSAYITSSLHWLEQQENHLVTYIHPQYPFLLKQIHSPPLVLFVSGDITSLSMPQVSVVGSRLTTQYGEKWAKRFIRGLCEKNYLITSGLAIGIDGICHQAALDYEGKTIAVLGSGIQQIYPARHIELAQKIKEQGAIISEYFPDSPPLAKHFPRRNRIISGLSSLLLVIEAGRQSGSLITAQCALEQGRDVFTIPASLGYPAYEGNHWLLKQGAYLATSSDDICEHLATGLSWMSLSKNDIYDKEQNIDEPKQNELPLIGLLANIDESITDIDTIALRSSLSLTEIASQLLELELSGKIELVSGGYIRLPDTI